MSDPLEIFKNGVSNGVLITISTVSIVGFVIFLISAYVLNATTPILTDGSAEFKNAVPPRGGRFSADFLKRRAEEQAKPANIKKHKNKMLLFFAIYLFFIPIFYIIFCGIIICYHKKQKWFLNYSVKNKKLLIFLISVFLYMLTIIIEMGHIGTNAKYGNDTTKFKKETQLMLIVSVFFYLMIIITTWGISWGPLSIFKYDIKLSNFMSGIEKKVNEKLKESASADSTDKNFDKKFKKEQIKKDILKSQSKRSEELQKYTSKDKNITEYNRLINEIRLAALDAQIKEIKLSSRLDALDSLILIKDSISLQKQSLSNASINVADELVKRTRAIENLEKIIKINFDKIEKLGSNVNNFSTNEDEIIRLKNKILDDKLNVKKQYSEDGKEIEITKIEPKIVKQKIEPEPQVIYVPVDRPVYIPQEQPVPPPPVQKEPEKQSMVNSIVDLAGEVMNLFRK